MRKAYRGVDIVADLARSCPALSLQQVCVCVSVCVCLCMGVYVCLCACTGWQLVRGVGVHLTLGGC